MATAYTAANVEMAVKRTVYFMVVTGLRCVCGVNGVRCEEAILVDGFDACEKELWSCLNK